jgi:light-regulated signal transduction histidine kinase (bacteriophytochrome)
MFSDKILQNDNKEADTEKYFKKIISSSQRMQTLINDLLSFSRQSMSASDFMETDLNRLVKEAISELEIEIEKTNARINVADLPVICAVPGLMRQLFYNLISNALKFRKESTVPIIQITAEKIEASNELPIKKMNGTGYYEISVSDNGIGFDPKYADEIFMVFKRLHSHHEFEGTGVGLATCKKIIEKHNGFITAQSKLNEGSVFTIGLPEIQQEKTFENYYSSLTR